MLVLKEVKMGLQKDTSVDVDHKENNKELEKRDIMQGRYAL